MGQCLPGGRFLCLGSRFVLFKNINSGLDIYGILVKFSEDMELERELMTNQNPNSFNRTFFCDPARVDGCVTSYSNLFSNWPYN